MAHFIIHATAFFLSIVCFDAAPTKWYVNQSGQNISYCGNVSVPCRTIRFTVNKASSGDTISIDYANGTPYEECPKYKNNSAIQLNKSMSFICPNGMAEIQCRYSKNSVIFEIAENNLGKQTISFISIKFSSSIQALVNNHNNTRILITRCLFKKNNIAIYMKNMRKCDLVVDNSTFIDNCDSGIFGKSCVTMMVRISNSTFQCSPVKLSDVMQLSWKMDKHFDVHIANSSFLGNTFSKHYNEVQRFLFQVTCSNASVLNISVVFSTFGNFIGNTKYNKRITGPIYINDLRKQHNVITTIYFNQVIVKNIFTVQRSTVLLLLSPTTGSGSTVKLLNCSFYNNTRALKILGKRLSNSNRHSPVKIRMENTIFSRNTNPGIGNGAAATLSGANYHIDRCTFVNNYSQNRYLTGVVVLDGNAWVTFERCVFENTYFHEPNARALQILSPGNTNVVFKTKNVFNMEKLRRNQPIIIHTSPYSHSSTVNFGQIFLHGQMELKCPVGYRFVNYTDKPITKTKDFQHLEFNCFQCSYKMYSLERDGIHINETFQKIECLDCPRAGVCIDGRLKSRPNFWGRKTTNSEVFFINCPPGYCCQSDDECTTYNSCHGNRNGTLCGRCKEGTSELLFGTECQPNKDCESKYFWIGISVIVPLYCLFFLYYKDIMKFLTSAFSASTKIRSHKSRDSRTESNSTEPHPRCMFGGYLKIIFYYYQIIHIFNSSIANRGEAFKLIDHFLTPIFNFLVSSDVFSIRCPFKDLQPIHKVAILNSLGFLLLIFIGLLFIAWKVIIAFKRSRLDSKPLYIDAVVQNDESDGALVDFQDELNYKTDQSFKCRIASAFTQISLLMYSSTAQLCLSLLHCVPIGGNKVLFIDGTLKCYQIFQYFAFTYVAINIIPFCLVPILGSYLLAFDSICLTEFCLGCLFPLPFCVKWALLLFKMWSGRISEGYVAVSSLEVAATPRSAILQVLLGPFRSHSTFMRFPESPIPWEGFLIFRRLVIILLFTFVHDVNLRMCLVLVACVIILILHLIIKPFKRRCDNILETLSLGILIILCGFTHVKVIYNDDIEATLNLHPHLLSWISIIECVLIVTPLLLSLLLIFCGVVYLFLMRFLKLMLNFTQ